MPVVAALYPGTTTNVDFTTTTAPFNFAAGLKNGTIQLIDSLSVELNNANVIQLKCGLCQA